MTTKRHKARRDDRLKGNLGQEEAKQQELSEEQFGHMKGGKPAKAIQQQKAKEQSKWQALCALWAQERPASTLGLDDKACPVSSVL